MCVIIDNDLAHGVFAYPCREEFTPLMQWVETGDGRIVHGGKLTRELCRSEKIRRFLMELGRQGKALVINHPDQASEEVRLEQSGLCESNDFHVLALAILARVRLLCSGDQSLHTDFRNSRIINNPRGHVYQNASHSHLLEHTDGCIGKPR
jgi:hypothetical protein